MTSYEVVEKCVLQRAYISLLKYKLVHQKSNFYTDLLIAQRSCTEQTDRVA